MKRITKHYFVPHEHNNFQSKLLHHSSLIALVVLLFITSISISFLHTYKPEVLGISYSISQQDLLDHTNRARQEHGLAPLQLNESLVSAANGKAQHMISNNYWAHFAPDGTSPWTFIKDSGYGYVFAGENLAKGFTDSRSIVDAWLNSPSHRDNLLSDKYKDIGFAITEGSLEGSETVLVVQMFGAQDVPAPTEQKIAHVVVTDTPTPTAIPVIELLPTATPTVVATSPAQITDVEIETQPVVAQAPVSRVTPAFLNVAAENFPVVNMNTITRAIPMVIVGSLLIALMLDFVIIKRRKIPRIVGHNLDHIMILGMFLLLLILQRFGSIL